MHDDKTDRPRTMDRALLLLGGCAIALPVAEHLVRRGGGLAVMQPGGFMAGVAGLALLRLKDGRLARFIFVAATLEAIICALTGFGATSARGRWGAGSIAAAYVVLAVMAALPRKPKASTPPAEGLLAEKFGGAAGRGARRWLDRL